MKSHAIRGMILVCASWLACFGGTSPGTAQSPVGLTVTICSKNDPKYQPQTGILVRLDEQYYIVHTSAGEVHFKRGDFENCQARRCLMRCNARPVSLPARAAAPARQARP